MEIPLFLLMMHFKGGQKIMPLTLPERAEEERNQKHNKNINLYKKIHTFIFF
jgi:hypothetical protein